MQSWAEEKQTSIFMRVSPLNPICFLLSESLLSSKRLKPKRMANGNCMNFWIPLIFVTLLLIISLLKNIFYCIKEKKQKGNAYDNYQDYIPSNNEFDPEEFPVYDNLNHHQDILNESCYEQMNAHPQTTTHEIQPTSERQMCYASLDHSVKRKQKHLRKNKCPTFATDEDQLMRSSSMPSDSCIYLNSEQLNAENKVEEATHEDPKRIFGFIHARNAADF